MRASTVKKAFWISWTSFALALSTFQLGTTWLRAFAIASLLFEIQSQIGDTREHRIRKWLRVVNVTMCVTVQECWLKTRKIKSNEKEKHWKPLRYVLGAFFFGKRGDKLKSDTHRVLNVFLLALRLHKFDSIDEKLFGCWRRSHENPSQRRNHLRNTFELVAWQFVTNKRSILFRQFFHIIYIIFVSFQVSEQNTTGWSLNYSIADRFESHSTTLFSFVAQNTSVFSSR